jgi:predicted deacylase
MNEVKKEIMYVGEMASGAALTVPVYRLKGDSSAPSVYIQANMHGAEIQGNEVIFQLLELLKSTKINGDITLCLMQASLVVIIKMVDKIIRNTRFTACSMCRWVIFSYTTFMWLLYKLIDKPIPHVIDE